MTADTGSVLCPLRPCQAQVRVVRELRAPGSTDLVDRLAEHVFRSPGTVADGQICPASLMLWPLDLAAEAALTESEQVMSAVPAPQPSDGDLWFGAGRPSRHSLEPHPQADPRWFRSSLGMGTASYGRWR